MSIAIIGAGMTGLTCARALADAGLSPVVFDKGRGLGGRLATRRAGTLRFDHGAQFVTARGDGFRGYLDDHAEPWQPQGAAAWFVGVPAMNALVKPMADGLDIRLAQEVAPEKTRDGWRVGDAHFDRLISTVPVVQARKLFPKMTSALAGAEMAPCWTLMVAFDTATDWPDMWRARSGDLVWIARNASKPGRDAIPETWIVHASPGWSVRHLEVEKDVAKEHLLDLLRGARGVLPEIAHASAHRWRYAMTRAPLGQSHVTSPDGSLLIGGDWCLGTRVEDAWDSGKAMAAAVLAR